MTQNTQRQRTMDIENKQDSAAMSPASAGSVAGGSDPDRMLAARLHGIADHSMSIIIGNMIQEMITELQMRKSPGHPGHILFTLTDAERQALSKVLDHYSRVYDEHGASEDDDPALTAIRGLLERTK